MLCTYTGLSLPFQAVLKIRYQCPRRDSPSARIDYRLEVLRVFLSRPRKTQTVSVWSPALVWAERLGSVFGERSLERREKCRLVLCLHRHAAVQHTVAPCGAVCDLFAHASIVWMPTRFTCRTVWNMQELIYTVCSYLCMFGRSAGVFLPCFAFESLLVLLETICTFSNFIIPLCSGLKCVFSLL